MWMNVTRELATLKRMTTKELKEKYEEVFNEQCRSNHRQWLFKRIIWRMQANQEGDLSERARQRAAEIANDADLRIKAPPQKAPSTAAVKTAAVSFSGDSRLPLPGAILTREYKGQTYQVTVHSNGFEWEGEIYKSLSAVANAITGTHTSGYLFFRIEKKGGSK